MMVNRDRALIVDDDSSALDLTEYSFAMEERLAPATGLILGLLTSVLLWLILGVVLAVLL
jgi:hypothetical protein